MLEINCVDIKIDMYLHEPAPFSCLPDGLKKLPFQGNQYECFGFVKGGKKYIRKELRLSHGDYYMKGDRRLTPFEVADLSNRYFQLIKKYLKRSVVDTRYQVDKNIHDELTVIALQPEIEGLTLAEIVRLGDRNVALKMVQVVDDFEQRMQAVVSDHDFGKFEPNVQEYFRDAAYGEITLENIMRSPKGKYILTDF